MNINKKNIKIIKGIVIALFAVLINAHLSYGEFQLKQLARVHDKNKTVEWKLNYLQQCLNDEIQSPTQRYQGFGGGYIDHEYKVAQIITSFRNVISPPSTSGVFVAKQVDIEYLEKILDKAKYKEARDVYIIVLGYFGARSVKDDLIKIVREQDRLHIRQRAISALYNGNYILSIPYLIEALDDPENIENTSCFRPKGKQRKYLVRDAALFALRKFGVDVVEKKDSVYLANKRSAVHVLEKELSETDNDKSEKVLKAISRVGGEYARESLENFIDNNKNDPEKEKLVSETKKLLLKAAPPKIETKK